MLADLTGPPMPGRELVPFAENLLKRPRLYEYFAGRAPTLWPYP